MFQMNLVPISWSVDRKYCWVYMSRAAENQPSVQQSMADLFIAAAAQIICYHGNSAGRQRPGHLLWHHRFEWGAFEHVIETAMGSIVWRRFQTQKIWKGTPDTSHCTVRFVKAGIHQFTCTRDLCTQTRADRKKCLTAHDVVKLDVFKDWDFHLKFKRRSITQEYCLKWTTDVTSQDSNEEKAIMKSLEYSVVKSHVKTFAGLQRCYTSCQQPVICSRSYRQYRKDPCHQHTCILLILLSYPWSPEKPQCLLPSGTFL